MCARFHCRNAVAIGQASLTTASGDTDPGGGFRRLVERFEVQPGAEFGAPDQVEALAPLRRGRAFEQSAFELLQTFVSLGVQLSPPAIARLIGGRRPRAGHYAGIRQESHRDFPLHHIRTVGVRPTLRPNYVGRHGDAIGPFGDDRRPVDTPMPRRILSLGRLARGDAQRCQPLFESPGLR